MGECAAFWAVPGWRNKNFSGLVDGYDRLLNSALFARSARHRLKDSILDPTLKLALDPSFTHTEGAWRTRPELPVAGHATGRR